MKVYGHPWSINTRKVLMVLAEKGVKAELSLVMVPKGEHKSPAHLLLHPFGKVPVLEDRGFVLYETGAINRYLARVLPGPGLIPADGQGAASADQWISASDSYFAPFAQPFLVETMFRKFLGGEANAAVIEASRRELPKVLDVVDRALSSREYLAGDHLSIADIHYMPYLDYLAETGHSELFTSRPGLNAWWTRLSTRKTWRDVAHTGPQPYDQGVTAEVIEKMYR